MQMYLFMLQKEKQGTHAKSIQILEGNIIKKKQIILPTRLNCKHWCGKLHGGRLEFNRKVNFLTLSNNGTDFPELKISK